MKSLSILVPTYARVYWLNECLWGLLRQDYPDYEIIILNDAPQQVLQLNDPRVTIINESANKYQSLGEKRNALMKLATKDWITWVDDDDLVFPWHASRLMEIPNDSKQLIKGVISQSTWCFERGQWRETASTIETAAERQFALATGGFSHKDCGEDKTYREALLASRYVLDVRFDPASYITRRHHVPMHISDSVNNTGNNQAFRKFALERMRGNGEPTGLITLSPRFCNEVYETAPQSCQMVLRTNYQNFFPWYKPA